MKNQHRSAANLERATDVVLVIEPAERVIVTAMHGYKAHAPVSH